MTTESITLPNDPAAGQTPVVETVKKPGFPWLLFLLLSIMTLIASVLIVPYTITLTRISSPEMASNPTLITIGSIVQALIINIPALLVGLLVARRLTLGLPYLEALTRRQPMPGGFKRGLFFAALLGFGGGVVLLVLSGAFASVLPKELTGITPDKLPSPLEGFLASISAGTNEEILLRLFLLSLIAWVIQAVAARRTSGRPGMATLWVANVLAAVLFGLLHMTNLAILNVPLTPAILGYIILMNGLAGLGFGWLYWTFGLELAMLAHFFTDIVLHVIVVLFTQ